MRILHTISSLNFNSGGPSLSTWLLISGLRKESIETEILAYQPLNPEEKMIGSGSFLHTISSPKETRFGYSKKISKFFEKNEYDIYHGHGLWQFPVHAMAAHSRKKIKPYIITPRGMLYPEGLKKTLLLKKLALQLYQRNDLRCASVIHATCKQEMEYIRLMGFKNPIAIIPNSIEIKVPQKMDIPQKRRKQIGFLGRFAPIKNLGLLIEAWAQTGKYNKEWELVLIGDGDQLYKNSLIQHIQKRGIRNIRFTGFLSDDLKETALQSLDYLVLPSKSENFGMVVVEALIREIPVIASKGTPWEELNSHSAGWWVEAGLKPLVDVLNNALLQSYEERRIMGRNGRQLIEKKYSIERVAAMMIELYQWILKTGEKPSFVYD